ncbi:MAG TPA: ABC transporter permease [Bryobacteraceae bacterium]|nr:ABC transporter permease [Bryobacteraceae bacterium]
MNLRIAMRMLRRNPGFTLLAVLTIALGIGVNTAVFSVVNGVLLRPLPFREPDQLVRIYETKAQNKFNISYPNFQDWKSRASSFQAMAIYNPYASVTYKGPEGKQIIPAAETSWNLFSTLGITPMLGRGFIADDDKGDGAPVAVITDEVWLKYFGGDPNIAGKQVVFSDTAITVIGVLPRSVRFSSAGIWFPMGVVKNPNQLDRGNHPGFGVVARLKPGVTMERARTEMSAIAASLEQAYPATNKGFGVQITGMFDAVTGSIRPMLLVLFCAVGFVLLIACVNVANLVLARTIDRDREVTVRRSLGASRWHLIGMSLSESLLISAAGTLLGAFLATWGVDVLLALQPGVLPSGRPITIDGTVMAYAVLLMLLSTLVFGLAPAWRAMRTDLSGALKQGGRSATSAKSTQSIRTALVTAEIALSIALLAGAGLMIRSLYALSHQNVGFRTANLLALQMRLTATNSQTPAALAARAEEVLDRLASAPGVESAAGVWPLPQGGINWAPPVNFKDRPREPGAEPTVQAAVVTPSYFKTMGIPLRRGRLFDAGDRATSRVALVNEAFAKKFYPDEDVLGKQFQMVGAVGVIGWKEIVGVVGDTRHGGLSGVTSPEVYWPFEVMPFQEPAFMVRTASDPSKMILPLRRIMESVDPGGVILHSAPIENDLADSVSDRKFTQVLLSVFAGLAVLMAAVGIYGVVAFWVAQRTKEIGLRVALGANAQNIFRLLLLQTMIPVGVGLGIGLLAATMLTPYLSSQIFGVTARDPWTLGAAAILLGLVGACASLLPARRAMRIDPMTALRQE